MQKPTNYDTTKAAEEFEPINLGGHKMVIKQVSEKESKSGLKMLVILFDFAEGDEQEGYFMKQFADDIRPDKKYPNAGTNYMVIDQNTEYGTKNLKTFHKCVEKSNPGFEVKWGDEYCQQFKGKLIGGIFRIRNDIYNGNPFKKRELARFRSLEGIKDVDVPNEVNSKEYDEYLRAKAIEESGTGFIDVPEGIQEELPFN